MLVETEDRYSLRRLIAATIPPLLIVGTWLLFARIYFGTFWPQTLEAKTAGIATLGTQVDSVWRQLRVVGATDGALAAVLVLGLLLGGALRPKPTNLASRWLPWAWVLGLPALYFARGVPVLSRYLLLVLPILAWLAWRSAERWWVGSTPTPARLRRASLLAGLLALLVVAENLLVFQRNVMPHVRRFTPALEGSLVAWGRWLHDHTPGETLVATPDIGAIGFFSQRPVLDLAGLVTPAMIPVLGRLTPEQAITSFAFASFAQPDYLIDRAPTPEALKRESRYGSALTTLSTAPMPSLGVSIPEPVVYTLYRVDWAVFDSLRSVAR
jgi:hypothetical protein